MLSLAPFSCKNIPWGSMSLWGTQNPKESDRCSGLQYSCNSEVTHYIHDQSSSSKETEFASKRRKQKLETFSPSLQAIPFHHPLLPVLTQSTTILPSSLAPKTVFANSQGFEGRKTSTELTGTCGGFPVPRDTTNPNFLTSCFLP